MKPKKTTGLLASVSLLVLLAGCGGGVVTVTVPANLADVIGPTENSSVMVSKNVHIITDNLHRVCGYLCPDVVGMNAVVM